MCNISIIVPVYNSEKYLKKTIQSILRQTYEEFELILVDDGSTDSSGKICDEFQNMDSRIRVVHKKNGGICSARNEGLRIAKGRYIGFCDNDDLFLENLLQDNLALAIHYNADVVRFSRRRTDIYNGETISVRETRGFNNRFVPNDKFVEYFKEINSAGEGVWAGIYKKEFLDRHAIRFDENMKYGYEDLNYIIQIYMNHPSVVLNNKVYYHWIMRTEHSTSAKTNINNIQSLMLCLEAKKQLYEEYKMEKTKVDLWIQELSARICQVIKYVDPRKSNMTLKECLNVLEYFGTCSVFQGQYKLIEILKMTKRTGVNASLVYFLFTKRMYWLLYSLVIFKSRLPHRKSF